MMIGYPKIESAYTRERELDHSKPNTFTNEFRLDEFSYLADNQWVGTEKVDGTNVRITYHTPTTYTITGRTDKAQLHPNLIEAIDELLGNKTFFSLSRSPITLYGEGYGPKIQSGGKYRADHSFVLFDVLMEQWWLERDALEDVASNLAIEIVPIVFEGTLHEARAYAMLPRTSTWGDFPMEGIVLKPRVPLRRRNGDRVITKMKLKDFPK